MTASESSIRHGSKIGRFVIVAELGSGGMGVVYAAHDRELDRQVALKVMRGGDDEREGEDRMRMLREGQAMARVTHANVITVYEVGTHGDAVFLAQELLDGGTLSKWLEQKHTEDEILEKFVAAGRGLAAAHAAGLVHRDFKPDNVLLGKDGRVRVADFGLARAVGSFGDPAGIMKTARGGGPPLGPEVDVTKSPLDNLTRTGAVMGTPMFMAPEQHEGLRADARSDQFAFCVALYHALIGDWPYEGKTSVALADNVINGVRKPPPKVVKLSPRVKKIIDRGLATNAELRYPSMDALLAELTYKPKPKWPFAVAGVVLVAAAGAGVFVMMQKHATMGPRVKAIAPVVMQRDFDPTLLVNALDKDDVYAAQRQLSADASGGTDKPKLALAQASLAFVTALGGDLVTAELKRKDAEANQGNDQRAKGYVELAGAAIALFSGDLKTAMERSSRCGAALQVSDPIAASICFQMIGETFADMDDASQAGLAYAKGQDLATSVNSSERVGHLVLAQKLLDFEQGRETYSVDDALAAVVQLQNEAHANKATSCEAGAASLAMRMKLVSKDADRQGALTVFTQTINPDKLEAYRLQTISKIARGEVLGTDGDSSNKTGIEQIDDVIADASKRGYWGLVLEAKLGRVRTALTAHEEGAEEARKQLVDEAKTKGYKRIARLAETYLK